jgi:hypothetical protein
MSIRDQPTKINKFNTGAGGLVLISIESQQHLAEKAIFKDQRFP